MTASVVVPYVDLAAQHAGMERELLDATSRVLRHAQFVLGPEVSELESKFAAYCGARHAVGVGNGTDAIVLALRALDVGPGHEVITAPNSFLASAAAIVLVGARPVFVDVGDDHNLDPSRIARAVTERTRAILAVHLRGRPARMDEIVPVARDLRLAVVEDAAQAVGAKLHGRACGALGAVACFSFHPLKNLAACGDGGSVTTDDPKIAARIAQSRNHGLRDRDHADFFAYNSRLDTLQAAFLLAKLAHVDRWNEARRATAAFYRAEIGGLVETPSERPGEHAVYHAFTIETDRRDELRAHLARRGVETKIHYRAPIHLMDAAKGLGYREGDFPVAERQARRMLSLPVYPELTTEQKGLVVDAIKSFA